MTRIPARRDTRAPRLAPATAVVAAVLTVAVASACGTEAEDRAATVEERAATAADEAPDRATDSDREGGAGTGPAEMCAAELSFRGTTYVLAGTQRLVDGVDGPVIGSATVPACDDTPGGGATDGGTSPRVDVQRLPGSPTAESVVADGQVWIAYP